MTPLVERVKRCVVPQALLLSWCHDTKVLEGCGIDTNIYSGFAFGVGLERIAMLKYGYNNIKLLFESDLRVLSQIDD